jgi:hypothetical protein
MASARCFGTGGRGAIPELSVTRHVCQLCSLSLRTNLRADLGSKQICGARHREWLRYGTIPAALGGTLESALELGFTPSWRIEARRINEHYAFPRILFAHWAAISSNQLYHTASVLLLAANTKPRSSLNTSSTSTIMWHVKRICGISMTNPHEGCLNNAIQPLWIAGRFLSHSSEQTLVVKTIRHIEALTGWTSTWRIRDLERTWGYKVPVEI